MSAEAKWYVLHTYSGYENKVASTLAKIIENRSIQDLICDIKIPTETVIDAQKSVERKTFPGYVFVKMVLTDDTWHIVRNIRGVTGFVGPESKAVPLTDAEVHSLGVDKKIVSVKYGVGDSVRITSGPLEDFVGTVDALDADNNYVKVIVSMFGRETPVELELSQVEELE